MSTAVVITVRSDSTRLPKKCYRKIGTMPSLEHVIRRAKKCNLADFIVVSTTKNDTDDEIVRIAESCGALYTRGPSEDKVARWLQTAEEHNIDFFVTVDADDLTFSYELVDSCFEQYSNERFDFCHAPDVACGLFTYGISTEALKRVCREKRTSNTEMMWPLFLESEWCKITVLDDHRFDRNDLRLTLDYEDDLRMFEALLEKSKSEAYPDTETILELFDRNPELKDMNFHYQEAWKNNQNLKIQTELKQEDETNNPNKYLNNEIKYLKKVLDSEYWSSTGGSWCQTLEEKFAEKFESKYAVAMNSGTSTLHAALEAVGVGAGDEVISPALTVIMDTTATIHANAVPVYADIDPETFNIDPEDIERKITDKTKAIIAVSLYGLPCDMDRIMEIANKHNIAVIEDNAQCFLSTYKGRLAGSSGHVSSWSFENSKHMSCGEGGIITTNNDKYAEVARKVAGHGYKNLGASYGQIKLNQSVYQNPNYKRHDSIGWNYRMPEFNAAIALAQLEDLEQKVDLRIKVASLFLDAIAGCRYITPQLVPEGYEHSYFTLGLLYEGAEKIDVTWEDFRKKYISFGGDGFYGAWSVPYLEPVMASRAYVKRYPEIYEDTSYREGLCPVAESIQSKLMQFKTNYRDMALARSKADALRKTINFYGGMK